MSIRASWKEYLRSVNPIKHSFLSGSRLLSCPCPLCRTGHQRVWAPRDSDSSPAPSPGLKRSSETADHFIKAHEWFSQESARADCSRRDICSPGSRPGTKASFCLTPPDCSPRRAESAQRPSTAPMDRSRPASRPA